MPRSNLVINIDEFLKRGEDPYYREAYPKKINEAKAILVKYDNGFIPYHDALGNFLHEQSQSRLNSFLDGFSTIEKITAFLSSNRWGRFLYFNALNMGPGINEGNVLISCNAQWDFAFLPGRYSIGDIAPEKSLIFEISANLIYDSVANSGKIERMGIYDGKSIRLVMKNGEQIERHYNKPGLNSQARDTTCKIIFINSGFQPEYIDSPWNLKDNEEIINMGYTGRSIETGIMGEQMERIWLAFPQGTLNGLAFNHYLPLI